MQPIIDIKHLTLQYEGEKLYEDFSFRVNAGGFGNLKQKVLKNNSRG